MRMSFLNNNKLNFQIKGFRSFQILRSVNKQPGLSTLAEHSSPVITDYLHIISIHIIPRS